MSGDVSVYSIFITSAVICIYSAWCHWIIKTVCWAFVSCLIIISLCLSQSRYSKAGMMFFYHMGYMLFVGLLFHSVSSIDPFCVCNQQQVCMQPCSTKLACSDSDEVKVHFSLFCCLSPSKRKKISLLFWFLVFQLKVNRCSVKCRKCKVMCRNKTG